MIDHGLKLYEDGTLQITMPKGTMVRRVLVDEEGSHFCEVMYPETGSGISEEPTYEQVLEYCNKRCMALVSNEFLAKLPSALPGQHGRIFQEIVVEYPSISTYPDHEGKPYFSIKYVEDGQCHIGYGTYKPEVLSEYMKKYFISSAQPEGRSGVFIPDITVKNLRRAPLEAVEELLVVGEMEDIVLSSAQSEIIRCKDCKYMTEHYDTDGNAPYWTCSEWDSGTDYDGFCYYAERRIR